MDWVKFTVVSIALVAGIYVGVAAADVLRSLSDMNDVWPDDDEEYL